MSKPNPFTAKAKKPNPFSAKAKKAKAAKTENPMVAKLRTRKEADKNDYHVQGVKLAHVRQHSSGGYWTVDVINGDTTTTYHNRHGSWMSDVGEGMMKEAGTLAPLIHDRWLRELDRLKLEPAYGEFGKSRPKTTAEEKKQAARTAKKPAKTDDTEPEPVKEVKWLQKKGSGKPAPAKAKASPSKSGQRTTQAKSSTKSSDPAPAKKTNASKATGRARRTRRRR